VNVLNFMNYLLRFSMLGFLVLVIVLSDPTLFPTMRLMAAILCGIVLLVGIGFVLRPRLPDPISGAEVKVSLATRLLMLLGGLSGVWTYFSV
jgi:hypothetical protein